MNFAFLEWLLVFDSNAVVFFLLNFKLLRFYFKLSFSKPIKYLLEFVSAKSKNYERIELRYTTTEHFEKDDYLVV